MISFLVDENGNKTHAVIPIDEYMKMKAFTADEKLIGFFGNMTQAVMGKALPSTMYDLTMILSDHDFESSIEDMIKSHYKYLETLSSKDFGLLYLMRSSDFNMFMMVDASIDTDASNRVLDFFENDLKILPKRKEHLTFDDFEQLQQIFALSLTPQEVVQKFNQYFKIGVDNYSRKIRRDAELKRLFFYDFSNLFPVLYPSEVGQIGDIKATLENLALELYPNNSKESAITQMNKAIRDAKDRIFRDGWKEYVGI